MIESMLTKDLLKRFPVEKKDEFLDYVLLTETGVDITEALWNYIHVNKIKNWKEGFEVMVQFSVDPSGVAWNMIKNNYAPKEWVIKVIEGATVGNPSLGACRMVGHDHASAEWARKIIENDTSGEPLWAAYGMVRDGYASREWFEAIRGSTASEHE